MSYKDKYFKYKSKYLKLKNTMYGGNITEVREAWSLMIDHSNRLRSTYPNFDGLAFWNKIKPFLEEIDKRLNIPTNWNPEHINVIENFDSILEQIPEKDEHGNLIENHHFLLQQLNIPTKDKGKPSFRRLMQIALNIGQLKPYINEFNDEIKGLINDNNLSDIDTYMLPEEYNKYIFEDADLNKLESILKEIK